MARCPFARWRPVKFIDRLDRMSGPPRAVFLHTNDGGADLTSWFDGLWDQQHQRLGCTFQVYNDGSIDQLCESDHVIFAQFSASEWAISIETEDDGDPSRPWTGPQLDAIGNLLEWLHDTHGIPLRLMSSSGARGIGYHQQFPIYNKNGHDCPGPVRLNQLVHTVIPGLTGRAAHLERASESATAHVPAPVSPLPLAADTFSADTQTWQKQMLRRGWTSIGEANGIYGESSRKVCLAFQKEKGLQPTGVVDQATWAAAWTAAVTRPKPKPKPTPAAGSGGAPGAQPAPGGAPPAGGAAPTKLSPAGAAFIGRFEGFRAQLYNDPAQHATIGFGHLVHHGPINGSEPAEFEQGITRERALELLQEDAATAAAEVRRSVAVPLSQPQFDALVSFTFNVGTGAFRESTLVRKLNGGDYGAVPSELARWVKAGGKTLAGLERRRAAEGTLFATGAYS